MHYTAAQCDLKKHFFIRAAPRQTGIALSCPVQKLRCVFPQNWALGPWGGQFVIFCLFCCCHIVPLKCLVLQCETCVGPEPALRWTPNRPVFWKKRGPQTAPPAHIYIYIYIVKYQSESWRWQRQERRTQNPWEEVKRGQAESNGAWNPILKDDAMSMR